MDKTSWDNLHQTTPGPEVPEAQDWELGRDVWDWVGGFAGIA
jgi:hypothetical protein